MMRPAAYTAAVGRELDPEKIGNQPREADTGDRSRPGVETEAARAFAGAGADSTVRQLDTLARARRVDHAVLVVSQQINGVLVSQLFTTLGAAEKKVTRTRNRGLFASLTLVRITPVASSVDPLEVLGGDCK